MDFDKYKDNILDWAHTRQNEYYSIRGAIRGGVQDLDDSLSIYAYALKLLDNIPEGLIFNTQGALVTRKLRTSKAQLYWKVVRMIWRTSVFWGGVFTVGAFMPVGLDMTIKAWLLDTGDMHRMLMRDIYREAAKHKVVVPYRHLQVVVFTNSLLLGINSEEWMRGDINHWLLMPPEDFKDIKNDFLKKNKHEK